ncbi:hypothetical protein BMS3Abin16_01025 [archaeon BMS3Abin16]|nr:hypothetical protein BMS3Abin16_01025 [archaeon BMS3Abin16]GBE56860.1 hypothetical protein BMS3Bbin16_01073 [archaeon BMS3Bbin16]
MAQEKKGFFVKLLDRLDEKLEKKAKEKESCDASEDGPCCR